MFLTKTALPRRTFLRGVGATVALPLLDAMLPSATALAQTAGTRPSRVGFIYVPHGADMASWTPTSAGTNFDLSPTLQTLASFKDSVVVVSNLRRAGGQAEMHAAAASGWLSGAIPKRTEAEDFACGTTIDQVLARKIGQSSPFPSLEFATEDFTGYVGGCTPGYSCAYHDSIAWATPTTPLPMEINPRVAFERMFGDGGSETERQHNLREDKSILDGVLNEMRALQARLGARDRAKVANYLDDVREIERRIQRSEAQQRADVTMIKPLGIPDSFEEHCSLMTDLIAVGLQAELTNVFTFMMSREGSQRTFSNIGISDPWHVTSHHGDKPEKIANNAKINVFCLQTFARLLEKLRATPDGDGTMLDHSLIFFGSGMANSNVHATDPLPMVAVGGGAGTKGNRHIVLPKETQLGNLWLNVANHFDSPMSKFGESTGTAEFF
ncbi:MAG TPA: DUF1552 domain-containing protein [Vicinamibacterales bacterium]|nr:DUF1552 domain-containing protein [Vicinamibacterales bacterium]